MDVAGLQQALANLNCYFGDIDGQYGPITRDAVMKALTIGPDYALDQAGVDDAAHQLGCDAAHIWTSWDLECTGSPFVDGRPTILPERHRFSRNTGHRFDASHPALSAPNWDRHWYPRTQAARYEVLLEWTALDVDAAFESCSYGGFQILGENFRLCDAPTPWSFAWRQAQTCDDQLFAYVKFVLNSGLAGRLRACMPNDAASCHPFCVGYNGTAERENHYSDRFAADLAKRMGQ
jgi:hypothetical protein